MIRRCALCQEPFTPQSNRQAFCSRLCRSRAERSADRVATEREVETMAATEPQRPPPSLIARWFDLAGQL